MIMKYYYIVSFAATTLIGSFRRVEAFVPFEYSNLYKITTPPRQTRNKFRSDAFLSRNHALLAPPVITFVTSTTTTALGLFRSRNKATKTRSGTDVLEIVINSTTDDSNTDNNQQQRQYNTETLKFGGKSNYTSSAALPLPRDIQTLHDFFAFPRNQKVLLTGGRGEDVGVTMDEINVSQIDSEKWIENARLLGGDEPDLSKDRAVRVTPEGIKILTVVVSPLSVIGTKVTFRKRSGEEGRWEERMPEYQAVLIEDYPRAEGPKLLVGLFNKIVYGGDPDSNDSSSNGRRREEKALLRFWAERQSSNSTTARTNDAADTDQQQATFVFKAEAELFLEFAFPRILLRFFPLSKTKVEEICSDAIVKALNLKLSPAVEKFTQMYLEQIESP